MTTDQPPVENMHDPCCSSHGVTMTCERYRRTHFVEVRPCCGADAALLRSEEAEQPSPSVEDARAEAEREAHHRYPGGTAWTIAQRLAFTTGWLAASRAVPSDHTATTSVIERVSALVVSDIGTTGSDQAEVFRAAVAGTLTRAVASGLLSIGRRVPSDHTATTEDAAAAVVDALGQSPFAHHEVIPSGETASTLYVTHDDEWSDLASLIVQRLASRGLLATARPDTTETPARARIHALTTPHGDQP